MSLHELRIVFTDDHLVSMRNLRMTAVLDWPILAVKLDHHDWEVSGHVAEDPHCFEASKNWISSLYGKRPRHRTYESIVGDNHVSKRAT